MTIDYRDYNDGILLKGRYAKVQNISEGSFGIVSLAKDTHNDNKLVAVKYITQLSSDFKYSHEDEAKEEPKVSSSEENDEKSNKKDENGKEILHNKSMALLDAAQEIDILTSLGSHPHITQLYDSFDCYILLEYCSRGDLYEAIRIGVAPSSTKDVVDVFLQLIDAVEYAHSLGIYHRDIKPENILISEDWSIKLTDWGLATKEKYCTDFDVGSERYMAPELLDHVNVDTYNAEMVDIWSMGICLLNVVFGKNPFTSASSTDKLFLLFAANRETLFDIFPSMSYDLFAVLRYSLTIDPNNRSLSSVKEQILKVDHLVIDYEFNEVSESELLGQDTIFESSVEPEDRSAISVITEDTELTSAANSVKERSLSIPAIKVTTNDVPEKGHGVSFATQDDNTKTNNGKLFKPRTGRDTEPNNGKNYRNGNYNHNNRGARKPLGTPNSRVVNENNLNYRHRSHNGRIIRNKNNNYYGNNGSDSFRRQDFFTPKSVFNHYMDKANLNKNKLSAAPDFNRDQNRNSNHRRGWRRNYNHRNSMSTAMRDKDSRIRSNNGLYFKGNKSYKAPNSYNGNNSHNGKVGLLSQGLKDVKISSFTRAENDAELKVPGSLGTSGKYIPPMLRGLRSPLSRPIDFDENALESDDDEVDDELFMLEDVKQGKKQYTPSKTNSSPVYEPVLRFSRAKKDLNSNGIHHNGNSFHSVFGSGISDLSNGENPNYSETDEDTISKLSKGTYAKYVPPHQRRNSHSSTFNQASRMDGVLKRQKENFDKFDKIDRVANIEPSKPSTNTGYAHHQVLGLLNNQETATMSSSVPTDTGNWFFGGNQDSKLDWYELDSSEQDYHSFVNGKVSSSSSTGSKGGSSSNRHAASETSSDTSADSNGIISKSEAKISIFKIDEDISHQTAIDI